MKSEKTPQLKSEPERDQLYKLFLESTKLLDLTFENSSAAMIVFEEDGLITRMNSEFEKIIGCNRAEIEGKRYWTEFVIYPAPAQIMETLQSRREASDYTPYTLEIKCYKQDRTLADLRVTVSMISGTGKALGSYVDISEFKLTQQALKESQLQINTIFKEAPFAILIRSFNDGTILEANGAFRRFFEYSRQESVGQVLRIYANPADEERILQRIHEHGAIRNLEINLRKKSGSLMVALVSVVPIEYLGQSALLMLVFDITERKMAEEALRENQLFVQKVIDMVPNPIYIYDIHENKFVFTNQAVKKLFEPNGVRKEIKSVINSEHIHPEDLAKMNEHYERFNSAKPEDIYEVEYRIHSANDEWLWLRNRETLFLKNLDGTAKQVLGVAEDITERKNVEQQLRQQADWLEQKVQERTADLQASNKELESFSYSVSHDLRAPLRSIDGFSLALLEDYYDSLDDQARDYLRRVRAASKHAAELIDDLLQLARVTRVNMKREKVDLSAMVSEIAAGLTVDNQPIDWHIQPGIMAYGDERLLRIVMENLLNNAVKFSGKRSNPEIEFNRTQQEGHEVFFVRDNGAGFDMSLVDNLFIPFQRLHSATEFPGTGIGLATVQRIIKRHNGRVWAAGMTGQGATFYFTLSGTHEKMDDTFGELNGK